MCNTDDLTLLRALDARKTEQMAAMLEALAAADALIDGLYRTRGTDPPALIAAYEVARAHVDAIATRHEEPDGIEITD